MANLRWANDGPCRVSCQIEAHPAEHFIRIRHRGEALDTEVAHQDVPVTPLLHLADEVFSHEALTASNRDPLRFHFTIPFPFYYWEWFKKVVIARSEATRQSH